jgi:hypothetical protein
MLKLLSVKANCLASVALPSDLHRGPGPTLDPGCNFHRLAVAYLGLQIGSSFLTEEEDTPAEHVALQIMSLMAWWREFQDYILTVFHKPTGRRDLVSH